MPVIHRDPESVEQIEIRLPEQSNGANTLFLINGRIAANVETGPPGVEAHGNEATYVFHAGPELEPAQIRLVRATASITNVYLAVDGPASFDPAHRGGDLFWSLGRIDAVHDDDVRKARVMVTVNVWGRAATFVRVQQLAFEIRILARL
jgi:hypothetical protein